VLSVIVSEVKVDGYSIARYGYAGVVCASHLSRSLFGFIESRLTLFGLPHY
jgi:hypothetical protein